MGFITCDKESDQDKQMHHIRNNLPDRYFKRMFDQILIFFVSLLKVA